MRRKRQCALLAYGLSLLSVRTCQVQYLELFLAIDRSFASLLISCPPIFKVYTQSLGASVAVLMIWEMMLFYFYFCLWILPLRRLYRRPAAIQYAKFWCLYRAGEIISTVLKLIPVTHGFSNCLFVFCYLFPFAILQPWILYYTLLQDSK